MRVSNFLSDNGNRIANQFFIVDDNGNEYFQSYRSIIAKKDYSGETTKIYLDAEYWDYSQTTGKYRNKFLGESKQETERKIKSGEYILTDLNTRGF